MRVQRVVSPNMPLASWTVLDGQGMVEPVERFLAHLTAVERSPNTVRAYAHDLRDFFAFLDQVKVAWTEVSSAGTQRRPQGHPDLLRTWLTYRPRLPMTPDKSA